jgi:hypothetical protein
MPDVKMQARHHLSVVLSWIRNGYLRPLVLEVADFLLLGFELDAPRLVSRYKASVSEAVEKVFDASGEIVWIKGLDAESDKADCNARKAFRFSESCCAQCCRFVTFSDGVR